jgi:hypothetical protein
MVAVKFVKGNDGRATQKARTQQTCMYMYLFALVALVVFVLVESFGGADYTHAAKKSFFTRAIKAPLDLVPIAREPISVKNTSKIDPILNASFHLVDIHISKLVTKESSPNYYDGIEAEFCAVDWDIYKNHPWNYPKYRDVVSKSEKCKNTRIVVNLKLLVDEVRRYDRRGSTKSITESLDPNFIFHESECGSTLLANALAYSNPEEHRVYSEAGPVISALRICGENFEHCTAATAATIFQDVIYIMSRVPSQSGESRLLFKMQSSATTSIQLVQDSFPKAPWIFVYRDPEEVLVSHLNIRHVSRAKCLQSKSHPPHSVNDFLYSFGLSVKELTDELYCAIFIGCICDSALTAVETSGTTGKLLNYDNLIEDFITDLALNHFGLNLGTKEVRRMEHTRTIYSKSREEEIAWVADSAKKQDLATDAIRKASTDYLAFSYVQLEDVRKNN